MNWRRLANVIALGVLCALLAIGCTSGAAAPVPDTGSRAGGDGQEFEEPDPAEAPGQPEQPNGQPLQADQQLIIYTGSLVLEVGELRPAIDQADQIVRGLGGHVAGSSLEDSSGAQYATVTYRIPAERWNEALVALRAVGSRVINESTDSEDVTAQVVDLDARIANLQATETALQAIMDRAVTIDDVLEVQAELTEVRGNIESLIAQRDLLSERAALATLEVTFDVPVVASSVASEGWNLGEQVDSAFATLVRLGQGLVSLVIWLLIVAVPIAVPIALVGYFAYRMRRRWVANHPPQLATAPAVADVPPPGPWSGPADDV